MSKPNTKLQIPLNKKLKENLDKKCESLGFYSANDVVRFMIQSFVDGHLNINLAPGNNYNFTDEEYVEELDEETEKRIGQALGEYQRGEYEELDPSDPQSLSKLFGEGCS